MDDGVVEQPPVPEGPGPVGEEAAPEVGPEQAGERAPPARPTWRKVLRVARYAVVLLVLLTVVFFSQTGPGQGIVLDEVLGRVRGSLAGELTVRSIESGSLLFGATLRGVRLEAEGGRRFLEADSLVLRYSPLSLAVGSPRVRSSTFYGLHVEISRYPGDDFVNVNRLLRSGPEVEDTVPSAPQTIGLGRVSVRGGILEILTPTDDEADAVPSVAGPDGARLRRIALEDLDLDIEDILFRSAGPVTIDARLASLSTAVHVLEEPLVIREARGDLSFGDLGLRIDRADFRLPGSLLEGAVAFGPDRPEDPWTFSVGVASEGWSDLADLGWLEPRIPDGRFRGRADVQIRDGVRITMREMDVESGRNRLRLDGDVAFTDVMSMRSLRVIADPVDLVAFEPWLERKLPFRGTLSGSATLGGTLRDLSATGRMTFASDDVEGVETTADFRGTVHTGPNPGASDLDVMLDPLDYRVLESVWPAAAELGTGRATFSVQGRAESGLLTVADLTHRSGPQTTSRGVGRGLLRRDASGEWTVSVRGELAPLSLPLLGRIWPDVDLPGSVRGPLRVDGRLTDLRVAGDLTSDAGRLTFEVRTDATAPARGYVAEADADALDLSAFSTALPSPSVFSGHVSVDGAGLALDSLAGSAVLDIVGARVAGLTVDSAGATLRVEGGLLTVDTVHADVGGVLVEGAGSVGLVEGTEGEARLAFSTESLLGLRPVFMGDSILVADTLNPLEEDLLRARGIDPDTLPSSLDVRLEGGLRGTADVRGWLGDADLDLAFDLERAAYGHNSLDSAVVAVTAEGLPATLGEWDVDVNARGLVWQNRSFREVRFDGAMVQRRGEGRLEVVRREAENYYLTGAFALDSLGGELQLTDAEIEVDELSWALAAPTRMTWNETSFSVDSLQIVREGDDPMRLDAAGTVTRGGDSAFRLRIEGVHVEQVLRIAQREDVDLAGHLDLELDVTGPAERPVIDVSFGVEQPRYGAFALTRLEGLLEYEDRNADVQLSAWVDDRRVLTGEGFVPVDLTLTDVGSRTVEEEMDLTIRADSLDAALALVYLGALDDVQGTVSAEMRVFGTPTRPEPSGLVTLSDAAWTIDAIGVRHEGVSGELLLQSNGTVAVKLASAVRAPVPATSTISGIVRLDPLSNPTLDLDVSFSRFLAVDRQDMQGRISGDLELTGRYQLPFIQGTLTMEEATLFVEEFSRNASVVDLRSPLLYAPGVAVDTTVFVSQPVLAGISNPFLDNLRVDVDLAVPRNLWLRSPDMNVEMGGDLIVRYDRAEGDLVMVGDLEALRGSYVVFGRTFDVDGGTASFLGQPGINPTLDIRALTRVPRREGDRLAVVATVSGTLVEPMITLSSEEAGLSESDLFSYLIFGQPSGEVGAGGIGGGLRSAGLSVATGTVFNQLGSAIAEEVPLVSSLDYLAFSQSAVAAQGAQGSQGSGNVLQSTQIELGKYLNDDVFVIFVLGGHGVESDSGTSLALRGVRMELAVLERLSMEVFWEERSLRTGTGLGVRAIDDATILGIFMFSEWGYGATQQD